MTIAAPILAAAGSSPRALWYLTRGAGAVTLLGLTATVVLGITDTLRVRSHAWPRFLVDALHRNVALITLAVLALHIATAVIDTFAPVRLIDAVLPFTSAYRPIWLGLGALAFDLLLAIALTSALRRRLGYRAWRGVHWAAYACWPIALVHGLGTGSDTRLTWMLALSIGCVALVLVAVAARLAAAGSAPRAPRLAAAAGIAAAGVGVAAWAAQGPLAPHWSRRAGTPLALVASATAAPPPARVVATRASLAPPFTASASGTLRRSIAAGAETITIALALRGGARGALQVRLHGTPLASGGVSLSSGTVTMGPAANPGLYAGAVASLQNSQLTARLTRAGGAALRLRVAMVIDSRTGGVRATVAAASDTGQTP